MDATMQMKNRKIKGSKVGWNQHQNIGKIQYVYKIDINIQN